MRHEQNIRQSGLPLEMMLLLALYIALPDYLAVELKAGLPLLTAARVLLVLAGIGVLLRRRDVFCRDNFCLRNLNLQLTADKPLQICMGIYFGLLLAINVVFAMKTTEGVKQIFVLMTEEYALVWILTMILTSRERIVSGLKIMTLAAGILGLLACLSVILDYNVFRLLDTGFREELVLRDFHRYGMLRPSCGFQHAVYYGAFCAVMLPVEMYLVEQEENRKARKMYALCTALTLAALLLNNSRGSQLAFGATAGLIFFIRLARKELGNLFKTYLPIILVALLIVALVFACCPVGRYWISQQLPGTGTPSTSTDATSPSDQVETPELSFGENPDGLRSRLLQLSGIVYTLDKSPLLGMGPNAHARGLVGYMYQPGQWWHLKTVDMNIVAIIGQYGLLGLLSFLSLYGGLGITFLRKQYRGDPLMHQLFLSFVCYMLCLLSISFLNKWFWVFVGVVLSLVNVMHKRRSYV